MDKIWPWVQKANIEGPAHAQIFKSKVLVTTPEKPLIRAGKGTVVRQKSADAYMDEIEALYLEKIENPETVHGLPHLRLPYTIENLQHFICTFLSHLLSWDVKAKDDIFVLGMDSLQTNQVANGLKSRLISQIPDVSWITPKAIYHNPTPASLARFCYDCIKTGHGVNGDVETEKQTQRVRRMEKLVERYTDDLPSRHPDERSPVATRISPRKRTKLDHITSGIHGSKGSMGIALTGSTGTLGTNLLQCLLEDDTVTKVYCLDRSATAESRQKKSFRSRGLSKLLQNNRVVFYKATFGAPHFGLETAVFNEMLDDVDVIIHNAWKVDFNHQLESFETEHIRSVRNLIDWSIESKRHPRIVFVSSLSSVSHWSLHHTGPVPEEPVDDYDVAQTLGYGESKHVAERILQAASSQSGVPVAILRVGQIAGSTSSNGTTWTKAEYLPSLIQTSLALGRVPDTLPGAIDWIPVDTLANIIVDLVQGFEGGSELEIFNLVNPRITKWESLLPALERRSTAESPLSPISFVEWTELLRKIDTNNKRELLAMPAAKIVEFYEDLQRDDEQYGGRILCETRQGRELSKTMQDLEPISEELMEIWLKQWGY